MIITEQVEKEFNESDICRVCREKIVEGKVRDHCHVTEKYRSPSHLKCKFL